MVLVSLSSAIEALHTVLFTGFLGTLLATLIGVGLAFWLRNDNQQIKRKRTVRDHLQTVRNELEENKERLEKNYGVLRYLSLNDIETDHYLLLPLSTRAWGAALKAQILDETPTELYQDLQDIYAQMELYNDLVERQRFEYLHPEHNQLVVEGGRDVIAWTRTYTYYQSGQDETGITGLGPLAESRGSPLQGEITRVDESTARAIQNLNTKVETSLPKRLISLAGGIFAGLFGSGAKEQVLPRDVEN